MSDIPSSTWIPKDISNAVWTYAGRSTVGFVHIRGATPASLGSGTLIRFGNTVGILTCAHVLEALLPEDQIGILCFPVRATQIQTLRVSMQTTDSISIGSPPWSKSGPDLAFLRLPASIMGDISRAATIANGDRHRQNIIAGEPTPVQTVCIVAGVVDEGTKPAMVAQIANGTVATTSFEALINKGNVFVDDENADRFRFQPVASEGAILPTSYKGTSGGGLWEFFLSPSDVSFVQARLVGVAYWEERVGDELHIVGHGPVSIYETLYNAVRQKWG